MVDTKAAIDALNHNFVSTTEIAQMFGFGPNAVSNWAKRFDDFPAQHKGKLYLRNEILAWADRHNRKVQ